MIVYTDAVSRCGKNTSARIQSQLSEPREPAPNKIEQNAFISKVCYVSYATVR